MKQLLPFGLTNVPAYLSAMMVQVIDRPIVQAFLGLFRPRCVSGELPDGNYYDGLRQLFEYAWRPFFLRESMTDDQRARLIFRASSPISW